MKVLVINCGSSSIKYEVFAMEDQRSLATGLLEKIGEPDSRLRQTTSGESAGAGEIVREVEAVDHRQGFEHIAAALAEAEVVRDTAELFGIGHRAVHGGEIFKAPTLVDQTVLDALRHLVPLAPLHNPANIVGIEVAMGHCPDVPQVAVFDTAFHQSMPPRAYHYALPYELYTEHHVRRYGFHGTSHFYVAKQAAKLLERPLDALNLIILHLGNGASVTAVAAGKSVDTSMGLTPLEGLIMGTRSGDLDPAIVFYLARVTGKSNEGIDSLLNKDSGLKGICGVNDMRTVLERAAAGDERAELALDMYCYRIKKYVGAYTAVLGRVDAVVFTGGIGENAADVRERSLAGLEHLGVCLEADRNRAPRTGAVEIQAAASQVKVLVVPTNEELEIAEQTVERIRQVRETAG